jgi:hypothetical protein
MRRRPVHDSVSTGDDVKHYSLSQWTDFARRVTTAAQSEAMQKHLGGCDRCRSVAKEFQSVADFAQRESSYTPSEDAVRIAQSYFAPMKMAIASAKPLMVARLTFDSARAALAEGFRATHDAPRQLLYINGNTVVDVRIEADSGSNRMVLGGQVLPSHKSPGELQDIQVSLLSGLETVATTATNRFGEFHMSLTTSKQLQLLFELQTGTLAVQVPDS